MGTDELFYLERLRSFQEDEIQEQLLNEQYQYYMESTNTQSPYDYLKPPEEDSKLNQPTVEYRKYFYINENGLQLLISKRLDLNHLYVLELLSTGSNQKPEGRLKDWTQTLIRKGYLTGDYTLTLRGESLLADVQTGTETPTAIFSKKEDPFELWWHKAYPATDRFEMGGKLYLGTQKKHWQKEKCRILFWDAINQLKLGIDDIYWATIAHVEEAKLLSLENGASQLKYIPNSYDYLKNHAFLPFLEAGRKRKNAPVVNFKDPFTHNI